jgi:hypothetical protein
VLIDDWNKRAVEVLLKDADGALALTELEDVPGNEEIVQSAIANAHRNYIDLVRRGRPLIMTDGDLITFQRTLDRVRARLRFFGQSV